MTLKVTRNDHSAASREFPTLFEAGFHILDAAVECPDGVQVEDSHTGRIFQVQHVADRLPRVVSTTEQRTEELKAA